MAITKYYPEASLVLMGLSTDTMPTNVAPGTRFLQTDLGLVFMFYNTGVWTQVGTLSAAAAPGVGI